jgi:NADH-quinone oxidoreductase subunit C
LIVPIDPAQPRTEDTAAPEQIHLREAALDIQLSDHLRALRDHLVGAFADLEVIGFRGELTLIARPERLIELLHFCRDDPDVRCEYLMDLSGRVEVDYILYSVTHNHRFRIRVTMPDEAPELPSATGVYASANFMEREVFDFFGVHFVGHPDLRRILMPDEWEGYPHRRDYPLGGVEVQYKGATIPPPDQRHY